MHLMLQRGLAPGSGLSRQGSSSDLQAVAKSGAVSRSGSFSRRAPGLASLPHSRSRGSLLAVCSTTGGEGDADSTHKGQGRQDGARDARRAHAGPHARSGADRDDNWDFSAEPYVPSPSNLPTHEEGPLLYPPRSGHPAHHHSADIWTLTDQPGLDLFLAGPMAWSRLRHVFVILFGVGERETEGIYSLRAFGADGIPHETIIAFESEEDAQRYAGLLEASMDHTPHVCSIPPRELLSFCLDQSYSCRMEPKGSLLIPPDFNVRVTDWERSLRLRDGQYVVLDAEPDRVATTDGSGASGSGSGGGATATATKAAGPAAPPGTPGAAPGALSPRGSGSGSGGAAAAGGPSSTLARYSGLSPHDLAAIRARLEALLPADS